jgi:hypothetical protein
MSWSGAVAAAAERASASAITTTTQLPEIRTQVVYTKHLPMRWPTALVFAMATASCSDTLSPGSFGNFRYVGQARGNPPLPMVPPVSDRNGNIYSLAGSLDQPLNTEAFVSRFSGGSSSACTISKGDSFGVHGWVGIGQARAWYWAGDALVAVSEDGFCTQILDKDPSTNANLLFRAVIPWVREGVTSHAKVVALVESLTDPAPFSAMVDLDIGILTNVNSFNPPDATDVKVIGVGSDPATASGFVLLEYQQQSGSHIEGRFYDSTGALQALAEIAPPPKPVDRYAITGFLQINPSGTVAGLTNTGLLVTFDRNSGAFSSPVSGMTPIGVHRWNNSLWLVGTADNKPMIAALDDSGQPGQAQEWVTSETAAAALAGPLTLKDDRSFPARTTTWPKVASGIGPFPFVSAQSPWQHSGDTTLWAVAGPGFTTEGFPKTAFAVAPAGLSYP